MIASIGALHVVGWLTLLVMVVPQHASVGTTAFGLGITAYMLGVRHAFDADHIAAIDNTTRRLMHEGKRPLSVGFWFSFGHSSVVFGLTSLLAFGIRGIAEPVLDGTSSLHDIAALIGTIVSSGFLYLIAALNIIALADIWRIFRQIRTGRHDEGALESQLESRGIMSRLLKPAMKLVSRPGQMYFVGLLFGLGFDTATEIALLVLTSSGAASGLPWYAILCLPVLFAAGMSLFDAIDGSFMTVAYSWALARPVRKIYYNLVITSVSVAVALIVGTVEIAALIGERLQLNGPLWAWATAVDLNRLGFIIVGLFIATWVFAIWKYGSAGERARRQHLASQGD